MTISSSSAGATKLIRFSINGLAIGLPVDAVVSVRDMFVALPVAVVLVAV